MQGAGSSETYVLHCQKTRCGTPGNGIRHSYNRLNLKFTPILPRFIVWVQLVG
jgi:hypothetical protein